MLTNPAPNEDKYRNLYRLPGFHELDIWNIDYSQLKFEEKIGEGNFGSVHKGTIHCQVY